MRRSNLRSKLFTAFVLLLTLEIFTGIIAIQSLTAVNREAATVRDHWLPNVSSLGLLIDAVKEYRLRESEIFLARSPVERISAIETVGQVEKIVNQLRLNYRVSSAIDDIDQSDIREFDRSWSEYVKASHLRIRDLSEGTARIRTTQEEYRRAGSQSIDHVLTYLGHDLSHSRQQGRTAANRGEQKYRFSLRFIYFAMVVAVMLSAMLGIYLTSIIAHPIGLLTASMRHMEHDDLDIQVPELDRADELGVMARALNDFKNRLIDRRRLIEEEKNTLVALHQAQKELIESEKLASLGRLVAGVAHEINTPLGSSYVVATTLIDGHRDFEGLMKENRIKKSDLEAFVSLVGRASSLIETTLRKATELVRTFKQVAVDQSSDQRRTFDLRELVQNVEMTVQPLFKSNTHRVEIHVPTGIQMDSFPGPLGQVINNLLTNAFIHAFDSGTDGTIDLDAQMIGEDRVALKFTDSGKGISEDNLPHIFEPFFTTRLGKGGSGLGLNIVYGIVTRLLGGTISVESLLGHGTVFTVELPLRAPDEA